MPPNHPLRVLTRLAAKAISTTLEAPLGKFALTAFVALAAVLSVGGRAVPPLLTDRYRDRLPSARTACRRLIRHPRLRPVDAMIPAMFFLAFWAALAAAALVALGIETKGRSIEEIDASLTNPTLVKAPAA